MRWASLILTSYKNPWENPFLLSCWHILKMSGGTSYPRLLQQMNLRFIILKWEQNGNPWNGTILSHPGRKSDEYHCQWATSLVSSETVKEWFLWLQCWEGRQSSPTPASGSWQNSESILDEFSLTRIQQESCFRQWRLHTSLKTWEAITEFGWTLLPHPPHSLIKHPQISTCMESWSIHSIVWSLKLMAVWLMQWEHGYVSKMAWYRQEMDMLILLWHKAMKVDRFLVEKQGIDQKPSVLTVCNFCDSEINIDRKEEGALIFWALFIHTIL